jgi:hypothetical protein
MVVWNALIDWDDLPNLFVDADDLEAQLKENLEFLKERPFNMVNNTVRTTTSTSFVEMVGSPVSLTSFGGNMLIVVNGKVSNTNAGTGSNLDIAIDGTRVGDASLGLTGITHPVANYLDCLSLVWFSSTPPSAGSHAYSLYWKTSANTLSGLIRLYVMEIG